MPLFWVSTAFVLGILLGSCLPLPWYFWLIPVLPGLGLAVFERKKPLFVPFLNQWRRICPLSPGVLLIFLCLGAVRFVTSLPVLSPGDLAWYNGQVAQVVGVIDSMPEKQDQSIRIKVRVSQIVLIPDGGLPGPALSVNGNMLAHLRGTQEWAYGDQVSLQGELLIPPEEEGFSYRQYLSRQGIYSMMEFPVARKTGVGAGSPFFAAVYNFRLKAYDTIKQLFPPDEAALLSGILLGLDMDIPDNLVQAFQNTGTSHIIAISGFNISIIAALAAILAARLIRSRWKAFLATICLITFYTLLVGATPSVVRAAIMGGMTLMGRLIGRRNAGANSLAFTAALMCLGNPLLPWDASFQLSFGAMLGLVLFAEPLENWFIQFLDSRFPGSVAQHLSAPIGEYLLVTLAAQVTTLPILAYHFQQVSLLSFIANPLVLPPQPAVMILGGAATLAGMVFLPLGKLLALFALPTILYTNHMVELLAGLPGGVLFLGDIPAWTIGLFYLALGAGTIFRAQLAKLLVHIRFGTAAFGLGLAAMLIWLAVLGAPDGKLHISLLDVEGGPAVLLQTPAGQNILVNGGSNSRTLGREMDRRISPVYRNLDVLILANPFSTNLPFWQEILRRYPPGMVLWGSDPTAIKSSTKLENYLHNQPSPEGILKDGQELALGNGVILRALSTDEKGTVFLVEWQRFRLIWDGRSVKDNKRGSLLSYPGLSGLIIASPSADKSLIKEWVQSKPGIIMTGNWGSAAESGVNWLDTSAKGWISLSTDGQQLWIETQK